MELIIVVKGRRLGSDRGVVWFDGGLMGFSGAATSFVLAAGDVAFSKAGHLPKGTLSLRNAPVKAYIVLTPIGKTPKVFWQSLKEFLAARVRPEGERIWPPLEGYEESAVARAQMVGGETAVSGLETPKEGRWIAKPRKSRPFAQYGALFLLAIQLPNWLRYLFNGYSVYLSFFILAYFAIWLGLIGIVFGRAWFAQRITAKDVSLIDGAFGEQFPVELIVVAKGKSLGSDRGVAWFDGGLLGFSGTATSFVLAASDFQMAVPRQRLMRPVIPERALILRNAPVDAYIVLTPIGETAEEFRKSLGEFRSARAVVEGERVWPPLEGYEEGAVIDYRAEG